ncbi:MAG: ComF family protein [Bacteroidia bacterium]
MLIDFFALIYPENCAACGQTLLKNEETICTECILMLPKTYYWKNQENPVSKLFWGRIPVENACSFLYFTKGGKVQHLLHQLKYKGNKNAGYFAAKLLGLELKDTHFNAIDAIIPVPLHMSKLKKRGYNQSEIIANGLSEILNKPVKTNWLVRKYASETQTKKSRFKRWENVKEIFATENETEFEGKHLLIVDDVITTGSTIEACAQLLLKVKDVKISIVALASA